MKVLVKLSTVVLLIFLTGCAAKIAPKIDQGGFLKPDDYEALQNAINHLPQHHSGAMFSWEYVADKPWSPMWVYYAEGVKFDKFDTITIPDLELPVPGNNDLLKEIPDAIQKELLDKKLFRTIFRESPHGGLALIGSLTRERDGSVVRSFIAPDSNIIQVEFKITKDDRQVGAIQAYAINMVSISLLGALARAIEGSLADQIAERVALAFEGLLSGKTGGSAEGKQTESDWIVPATIPKQ